ncbi:MAG: hypothetical protein AAF602_09080 [Myxococcota bacterium]
MRSLSVLFVLSVVGCSAEGSIAPVDVEPGALDDEAPGRDVDDPAPSDPGFVPTVRDLGTEEREALAVALEDSGVLDSLGLLGPFAVREMTEVATLQVTTSFPVPVMSSEPYEGGGVQIDVDLTNPGPFAADVEITAVLAWKGLDVMAQTVDEAIAILAPNLVDVGTSNLALPNGDPADGTALVYLDNPMGLYAATAGTFDIDAITLANPETCLGAVSSFISCEVTDGDLDGSFDISGEEIETAAAVQVTGMFDIPAVRISLTDAP